MAQDRAENNYRCQQRDVRFGSLADIRLEISDVRFAPNN
jgi:hypothetical protein